MDKRNVVLDLKELLYRDSLSFEDESLKYFFSYNLETFWSDIKKIQQNLSPVGVESIFFNKYNLYHDFILRYRSMNSYVFSSFNIQRRVFLTYSDFYRYSEYIALEWEKMGVEAGHRVAVILPIEKELVIALGIGLKLGLILSFFPPLSKSSVERKLNIISPDFICTNFKSLVVDTKWEDKILPIDLTGISEDIPEQDWVAKKRGYSYNSKDTVFELLDGGNIWQVGIDEAYLMSLANALTFFDLAPQSFFLYMGDSFYKVIPSMILMCMSVGGGFVYVDTDRISYALDNLEEKEKFVCMLDVRARDELLKGSFDLSKNCSQWFKDPTEDMDLQYWNLLIKKLNLEEAYCGNVKWEPKICGCSLISPKIKGFSHFYVLPPFGIEWKMVDILGLGKESKADMGFFSIKYPNLDKEFITDEIVMKYNDLWVAGGKFDNSPQKSFTNIDLCEFVKKFLREEKGYKGFVDAIFVDLKAVTSDPRRALLIFVPEGGFSDKIKQEVLEKIKNVVEKEFLPEDIEFFSIFPKYNEKGEIDRDWCVVEYVFGRLRQKENDEVYRLLNRLKILIFKN